MLLPGAVVEEASTSAEEAVLETAAEAAEATSAAEAVTECSPWAAAESAPGGVKGRCGGRGWLCAAAACWKCCRW